MSLTPAAASPALFNTFGNATGAMTPIVAVGSDLGVFRAGTQRLRQLFGQDGAREARA